MDTKDLRIEMMKAYSNAIDSFSLQDNEKAYQEMMKASFLAKDLAKASHNMVDLKEYYTLADYYYRKAQTYQVKEENHLGKDVYLFEPPTQGFADFIGLEDVKTYLQEEIITPWQNHTLYQREKNALLFYGPYGVGKTRFVHSLLKELNAKVYYFRPLTHFRLSDFADIEYTYRQIFKEAEKKDNVVFFIESPLPFFSNGQDELSKDTTALFVRIFKSENRRIKRKKLNILLIATSSTPDKLSQKALSKGLFDEYIKIPLPDETTRQGMIERYLKDYPISAEEKTILVTKTNGLVNKDLSRLCKEIIDTKAFEKETLAKVLAEFKPIDDTEYEESVRLFEEELQKRANKK